MIEIHGMRTPETQATALEARAVLIEEDAEPTPRKTVEELDRYVISQDEAKKAVAIALRNRWRRLRVP